MIRRYFVIAFCAAAAAAAVATTAFDESQLVAQSVALRGGSILYVFRDGKMAMENPLGRPVSMPEGQLMFTQRGQMIIMVGNEVARLEYIQKRRAYRL